ncbi:MAG: Rpn family recombination-promoting nuclease/putative transposase [Treponema sp.]
MGKAIGKQKKKRKLHKQNRQYKDSVFVDLFTYYEDYIVSLYNALSGKKLSENTHVENLNLKNSLYTNIRNDVSFLIDNIILVLIEHQSTINKNMPLRLLLYVAEIYKNILDEKIRYSREQQYIPTPIFYVLYNGKEAYPEESVLHLSDAFKVKGKEIQLQLDVKVININNGKNEKLMKACNILKEYAMFVEQVRKYVEKEGEAGFGNAIRYCIEHDILKDYLSKRFKVVENMLTAEYNYEMDIAVQRSEEYKLAYAEGEAKGEARGEARGRTIGEIIKQKAIALKLLAMKSLSIEQVSQATELPIEEIKSLIHE